MVRYTLGLPQSGISIALLFAFLLVLSAALPAMAITFSEPVRDGAFTTLTMTNFDPSAIAITQTLTIFHPKDHPAFVLDYDEPKAFLFPVKHLALPSINGPDRMNRKLNFVDPDSNRWLSTFTIQHAPLASNGEATWALRLPLVLPWCIDVVSDFQEPFPQQNTRRCFLGPALPTPFHQLFPTSVTHTGLGEYTVIISGLEAFSDPQSALWKGISIHLEVGGQPGITFVDIVQVRGYTADPETGDQFGINNSQISLSVSDLGVPTIDLAFIGVPPAGLSAIGFVLNLSAAPLAGNLNWLEVSFDFLQPDGISAYRTSPFLYEFGNNSSNPKRIELIGSVQQDPPLLFLKTDTFHREVKITFLVNKSDVSTTPSRAVSRFFLGQSLPMENDVFWLGCEVTQQILGGPAPYVINSNINGYSMYSSFIDITWNDTTQIRFSCTLSYNNKATVLHEQNPYYYPIYNIYAAIMNAPDSARPYIMSSSIPIQSFYDNSVGIPNLVSFPAPAPTTNLEPLYYGWRDNQLSTYRLSIQQQGFMYAPLPDFHLVISPPYNKQLKRSTKYLAWGVSNPSSNTPLSLVVEPLFPDSVSPTPQETIFFGTVSAPDDEGIFLSPFELYEIAFRYQSIPGQRADGHISFELIDSQGSPSETSMLPMLDFTSGQVRGSAPILPAWVPDMTLAWPQGAQTFNLPASTTSFTLVFTFKSTPQFLPSPSQLALLPSDSLWKTPVASGVRIYPGTKIVIELAFTGWVALSFDYIAAPIDHDLDSTIWTTSRQKVGKNYRITYSYISLNVMTLTTANDETFNMPFLFTQTFPKRTDLNIDARIFTPYDPAGTPIVQPQAKIQFGTNGPEPDRGTLVIRTIFNPSDNADSAARVESFGQVAGSSGETTYNTPDQTIMIEIDVSTSEYASVETKVELFYYPLLSSNPDVFSTKVTLLRTLKSRAQATPTNPIPLLPLTTTRGYSRVFIRTTQYATTADGDETIFMLDSSNFHTILPKCLQPVLSSPDPFTLGSYSSVCTGSNEVCNSAGICSSTTNTGGGGSTDPDADDFCQRCHPTNTDSCITQAALGFLTTDVITPTASTFQPYCGCKEGFIGLTCSEVEQCEESSTKVCIRKNGYAELIDTATGKCDSKCTCYNEWIGKSCQICALNCFNSGIAYNDCRRCGCSSGYSGNRCQCQTQTAKITLNGKNDLLVQSQSGLVSAQKELVLSATPIMMDTAYQYPFALTEVDVELIEMIRELYLDFTPALTKSSTGTLSFNLSTTKTTPSTSTTTFTFSITFACDDSNKDITSTDVLTELWAEFSQGFVQLPTIRKYFDLVNNTPEVDPLTPTPETLPPDDEQYVEPSGAFVACSVVQSLLLIALAIVIV